MKASTDQVLGYYGLPSVYYENYVSKEWWGKLTDTEKKEILISYIEKNPHKKHLLINIKDSDLYLVYLFHKYVILKCV